MDFGVQFQGSLPANASAQWITYYWSATSQVVWTVVPMTTSVQAEITWSVSVGRVHPTLMVYWITVTNLTASPVTFEARYAALTP